MVDGDGGSGDDWPDRTFEWDFLVSHVERDRAWAEWVAWQLEQLTRSDGRPVRVLVQLRDMVVGTHRSERVVAGISRSKRTAAILSPAYLESEACAVEWRAAWRSDISGRNRRLLPLRVVDFVPSAPPFDDIVGTDLFGVDETVAAQRLAVAVRDATCRDLLPVVPPLTSVGTAGVAPRFPLAPLAVNGPTVATDRDRPVGMGEEIRIWNVPPRTRMFVGRDALLLEMRKRLFGNGRSSSVYALHGMSGVGKTRIAVEYAHRFQDDYRLVWWLPGDRMELLVESLAALALRLGFTADLDAAAAAAAAREALRERDDWLLVIDDAEEPAEVMPLLPDGRGHILILSRHPGWTQVTGRLSVGGFDRSESVMFLRRLLPTLDPADAGLVAEALGDLPLALGQAGGLMVESGLSAADYVELVRCSAQEVLVEGAPADYPRETIAAAWRLSFDHLAAVDPAAVELLGVLSFLGSQPFPLRWIVDHAPDLDDGALGATASNRLAFTRTVARINRAGTASVETGSIHLHRVVQALVRDALAGAGIESAGLERVDPERADSSSGDAHRSGVRDRRLAQAASLVVAVTPVRTWKNPAAWDTWSVLLPHALAVVEHATQPGETSGIAVATVCELLDSAGKYLLTRGEVSAAKPLFERTHEFARERLGEVEPVTLDAANNLAYALRASGELAAAFLLDQNTLASRVRLLGEDHPDTLVSASNVAADLRGLHDVARARALDEDVFERSRRLLGIDHPDTLISAGNLALDLRMAGDAAAARNLDEDVFARRVRTLGDEHIDTLLAAHNLASALRTSGDIAAARRLDEDTLARRRRILGEDHPQTLQSANSLAADLRDAGDLAAARCLDEDTLARRRRILGKSHPDTLESAHNLAADLRALGESAPARVLDQDVLGCLTRRLGADHPETLESANSLAGDLRTAGDAAAARDLDADTFARRRRVLGADHPETLKSEHNLAADLRLLGQPDAARSLHEGTLPRLRRVLGDDHPLTMASASNLAAALRDLDDLAAASALDQQVLARRRAVLGDDHPHTLTSAHNLALDLVALGRTDEAGVLLTDTLGRRTRLLGADHPDTTATRATLAELGTPA